MNECPVCGGDCVAFHPAPHPTAHPFVHEGIDMADEPAATAPDRIVDPASGIVLYRRGDPMTHDDAVRFGVVEARAHEPSEDRAHKPAANRGKRKGTKS